MNDFFTWGVQNAHWLWWCAGVLLLAGEMLVPGVYLLWIGLAASITGVFAWLVPSIGFEGHGLIFAALGAASIYVGHRYFYGTGQVEPDKLVNTQGQKHVGKSYTVVEAIENGRGHVEVGDSRWLAEGKDAAIGSLVRVIAVEGTVLVVEPVTE